MTYDLAALVSVSPDWFQQGVKVTKLHIYVNDHRFVESGVTQAAPTLRLQTKLQIPNNLFISLILIIQHSLGVFFLGKIIAALPQKINSTDEINLQLIHGYKREKRLFFLDRENRDIRQLSSQGEKVSGLGWSCVCDCS